MNETIPYKHTTHALLILLMNHLYASFMEEFTPCVRVKEKILSTKLCITKTLTNKIALRK